MVNHAMIRLAARELYERHGKMALQLANERADRLLRSGDQPALDTALLVLTEVEKLVMTPTPPAPFAFVMGRRGTAAARG